MKFSYSWLKELVPLRLDIRAVAQSLNETAFDTELGENKNVLEIKLPPNRIADASGHLGMARELARIAKKSVRVPLAAYTPTPKPASSSVKISVQDKKLCRRYTAAYIEGVTVGKSPAWMQKRLTECGVRPINAVVDITNYVMLEYGQPLHAFDFDKLASGASGKKEIKVRKAQQGEQIMTLEDKEYALDGSELVICDAAEPLAIAGIKGGRKAEIDADTTRVVVESANFDPVSIRRTSRNLGIRTDASVRFENDLDPNLTEPALRRACALVAQICSGKVAQGFVDHYPHPVKPVVLRCSLARVEKLVGTAVPAQTAQAAFASFCDRVKKLPGGTYILSVKTARRDIRIVEDAVEEIARFMGYSAIPEKTVSEPVRSAELDANLGFKWKLEDLSVKLGMDEVMNYSLVEERDAAAFGAPADALIRVTESVSGKYTLLRPGLLVGMLRNVHDNVRYFPAVRIFEIGKVFSKHSDATPCEEVRLALAFSDGRGSREIFLDLKGCVEALMRECGIKDTAWSFEHQRLHECDDDLGADITVGGKHVGWIGVVRDDIRAMYGIDAPVAFCELSFAALAAPAGRRTFQPLPKYPDALRDISFFAPPGLTVAEAARAMRKAAEELLAGISMFDLFEKSGQTSVSFHLVFRSATRTLTEQEVDAAMARIETTLRERGANIR